MRTLPNNAPVWITVVLVLISGICLQAAPDRAVYDTTQHWTGYIIQRAETENAPLSLQYEAARSQLRARLGQIDTELDKPETSHEEGFRLLRERLRAEQQLRETEAEYQLKFTKMRYRKAIEIIKMLYEKILSMDHHFSSLKAQQDLLKISNPHHYPAFQEVRSLLEDKMKKKFNFTMPELMQSNPYLSAAFSIASMMISGTDDKDKKETQDKIACILDFTVRMHNDLNVIYYETGYLRDANLTLRRDCEALFSDCSRQVGYTITLEGCRQSDDWERLYGLLDNMVTKALGEQNTSNGTAAQADPRLLAKAETNLQFAIDRVVMFITRYSDFVNQGAEYYKKFAKIADSYEHEKTCESVLPDEFRQLKSDIEQTLDKFNSAYRMPEVQGSRLKDMLYGATE
jgi:hypothetical protein